MKKDQDKKFEIENLMNLRYFLRMEVARSGKRICLKNIYIIDLLIECWMLGCKLADSPIDTTSKSGMSIEGAPIAKGRYKNWQANLYLIHTSKY